MAKKLRTKTVVYDRTTMEYVRKSISIPISDELARMLQKELAGFDFSEMKISGHGVGENGYGKISGLRTPLCSQKRFYIDPQFHVVDEEDNEIAGWRGF